MTIPLVVRSPGDVLVGVTGRELRGKDGRYRDGGAGGSVATLARYIQVYRAPSDYVKLLIIN
jgi:hypothetical protein